MTGHRLPTALREWMRRLRDTARPARRDGDLEEELRSHLEMASDEAARRGVPANDATRHAQLQSGAIAPAMEALRHQRGVPWLADLARDVRYGVRGLIRQPIFSMVAIASLALGIGANTAVFSVVDAVLLRTLPVQQPQELFFLDVVGSEGGGGAPPYPCFERIRQETTAFSNIAAFATDQRPLQIDGVVEQVFGQVASGNYFDTLGIVPVLGRLLTTADERLDAHVAVIGYGYWQRRFGGEASVIGRTVQYRDRTYEIVGVTPRNFRGLEPGRQIDLTVPITVERAHFSDAGQGVLKSDNNGLIGRRLVELRQPVLDLLDNKFLDPQFWRNPSVKANRKAFFNAQSDFVEGRWLSLAIAAIDRVYTLRGQIVHGAATRGGKLNRSTLRLSCQVLEGLLGPLLEIVIDQCADDDWPPICYPPIVEENSSRGVAALRQPR